MACNYAFGVQCSVNARGLRRYIVLCKFHIFLHLCYLFWSLLGPYLDTFLFYFSMLLALVFCVLPQYVFRYTHTQRD